MKLKDITYTDSLSSTSSDYSDYNVSRSPDNIFVTVNLEKEPPYTLHWRTSLEIEPEKPPIDCWKDSLASCQTRLKKTKMTFGDGSFKLKFGEAEWIYYCKHYRLKGHCYTCQPWYNRFILRFKKFLRIKHKQPNKLSYLDI